MFEDDANNEDSGGGDREANDFLKKRYGLVSLGYLLDESSRDSNAVADAMDVNFEEAAKSRSHTSIYIENTDSEEE